MKNDEYWSDFLKTGAVKDYLEYKCANMANGEQKNALDDRRDNSQREEFGGIR